MQYNASCQDNAGHHTLQHLNKIDSAASNKDRKNCQTSSTFPLSVIIVEETSPFNNDFEDKGAQKLSNGYAISCLVVHSQRRTFLSFTLVIIKMLL